MATVTQGFLSARLEGFDQFRAGWEGFSDKLAAATQQGLEDAGNIFVELAKDYCPVDEGTLRDSIQIREKSDKSVTVGPDPSLPYVFQREFGGVITAKNAPYLVFRTKDGQWHKCKSVNQPAHPYMAPAWNMGKDKAAAALASRVYQVFE